MNSPTTVSNASKKPDRRISRRAALKAAGVLGVGSVLAGLPGLRRTQGIAFAQEGPETSNLNFGIIALTDCSPIVIAHEKGHFRKYGITSTVTKGASWAAIRDSLSNGQIQATHMLIGMPLASTMGLGGQPRRPMVIPWLMNRNGQCISVKNAWKGRVNADPRTVKPLADQAKAAGKPLTFAMTFPTGTHAMWMRYWLGAGGIHPDTDVSLTVVPPPQMVANMRVGRMDGFCVGEPWNAKTIADRIGYTAITSQELWKDHPEKVCAFTGEFADRNPRTVKAVCKALHDASVWLDDLSNRPEQCEIVGRATYINCPPPLILERLLGKYDYGDGRVIDDPHYMYFSKNNCNYPQAKYAKWFLSQFRRWGMNEGAIDYEGVTRQVMRPDLYEEAMSEIGYSHGGPDDSPETLFDGKTFDPGDCEGYARSFEINAVKG
ncbi:MAG TPA: CmpA/NrtA family ABC transporter substrate-binding protein [Tepidisphaeraceae bacterium]|nr:CmpA/NrtA family ABC transporter substrate-binding protein [Tepidisphaeraceae bacterium]